MNQPQVTGAFTTISGMIGGVMKAITEKPVLMTISLGTLSNVMFYAAASAAVGYVVKKVLDHITDHINSKCNQSQKTKGNE